MKMINQEYRITKPISRLIAPGIFLITVLTACNMPLSQADVDEAGHVAGNATGVSILYPVDGAQFQVGDFVDVSSQIGDSSGVAAAILTANNQVLRRDQLISPVAGGQLYQPWIPDAPGTYELQVILETSAGEQHISESVTVIVGEVISVPPVTDVPQTETPPIETSAPDEAQATADQNVNCRKGPNSAYGDVGVFLQGQTAPITGRNQENSWYYIDLNGTQCWVWGGAVTATGDVNDQPLVAAPPLPVTETPISPIPPTEPPPDSTESPYTACHDYPDLGTCNSDPMGFGGCSWNTGTNTCQP